MQELNRSTGSYGVPGDVAVSAHDEAHSQHVGVVRVHQGSQRIAVAGPRPPNQVSTRRNAVRSSGFRRWVHVSQMRERHQLFRGTHYEGWMPRAPKLAISLAIAANIIACAPPPKDTVVGEIHALFP
jgi:hypothetical protein